MKKRFVHLHTLISKLREVYNPLNKLVRRIITKMKEFRTALVMTLIPLSFVLILEGTHNILFYIAGIALFILSMWLWYRTAKQIKVAELEEKRSKNDLTTAINNSVTAINNLVNEIKEDRAERNKQWKLTYKAQEKKGEK